MLVVNGTSARAPKILLQDVTHCYCSNFVFALPVFEIRVYRFLRLEVLIYIAFFKRKVGLKLGEHRAGDPGKTCVFWNLRGKSERAHTVHPLKFLPGKLR